MQLHEETVSSQTAAQRLFYTQTKLLHKTTLLQAAGGDNSSANISFGPFVAVVVDYLGPMAELRGEALV